MQHPLDTNSLIEWLKTKGPNEKYRYDDCHNCALAQYAKEKLGARAVNDRLILPMDPLDHNIPLPHGWDMAARDYPHTFGAMLERLQSRDVRRWTDAQWHDAQRREEQRRHQREMATTMFLIERLEHMQRRRAVPLHEMDERERRSLLHGEFA